ncbi:hypothetical protein Pfo_000927 [Paulownia fortunei]|nr:hypothetical protein Pfo_000927 [Paulownia fortunei]
MGEGEETLPPNGRRRKARRLRHFGAGAPFRNHSGTHINIYHTLDPFASRTLLHHRGKSQNSGFGGYSLDFQVVSLQILAADFAYWLQDFEFRVGLLYF